MDFVVPSMIMLYVTVVFIVAVVVIADPVAVELIVPFALAVTAMLGVVLVVPVVVGAVVVVVAVGLNIDDKVNSINGYVVVGVRHVPSDCCLEFGVVVVRLVAEVDTQLSVDDLTIYDLLHKKPDGSV